jgi:hypothetical protein
LTKKNIIITFSISSLIIGLFVYILFDKNIILLKYFNFSISSQCIYCQIIRNYLSDIFYMFFICSVCHLYDLYEIPKTYIIIIFLTPFFHEFLQFYFSSLGTFDIIDILFYILISLIYYFFIYSYLEKKTCP